MGVRASNSSTTRGRPPAMSLPATPPVWNVRIVSWVPGSPIDWAAMTPTASPSSIGLPVAERTAVAHRTHDPSSASQVSTERTRTRSIASSSRSITSSSSPTMVLRSSVVPSDSSTSLSSARPNKLRLEVRTGVGGVGLHVVDPDAEVGATVFLADDQLLGDVDEATGQVARVGGTQRGVDQTLAGAGRGDEVLRASRDPRGSST